MRKTDMCKIYWKIGKLLGLGLLTMALIGCAGGKSFDYQPTAGEMKPGPGALTGESGELTVYDSKKGGLLPKEGDPKAESATAASAQTGESPQGSATEAGDFQEFQEFQKWKKEKQEFHEYQEWKKSAQGSADFQEFQEYLEWKKTAKGSGDLQEFQQWKEWKSYQEWKKKQGQQ
jgi:hypothetical protein